MARITPLKNSTIKETIAKKASALFNIKGFSATSMRDIATAIGIEAPSLYNHISSKKEILSEICFRISHLFTNNIDKTALSDKPVLKKLESIIRFHITMMLNEYESVCVSEHEWKHLPEPHLTSFKNQRKSYRTRLANMIGQGIINKELNDIHPAVAVLSILSAISGIEYWQKSAKKVDAGLLEENMVKLLLTGIKYERGNSK